MLFDCDINIQEYIDALVARYNYRKLPAHVSLSATQTYLSKLPDWCELDGSKRRLLTSSGSVIANGYTRVVIGDYGPFIELSHEQIDHSLLMVEPGQEYRIHNLSYQTKYHYLTTETDRIKIYFQQGTVSYADYKIGMYYISPFELNV